MTTIDSRELRNVLGCFATGVTVVTAAKKGANYGMTVNSFSSVSLNPPLILWSLAKDGQSFDVFAGAEYFNIHILSEEQKSISNQFAGAAHDKFLGVEHNIDAKGVPVLKEYLALLNCRIETTIEQGDHLIIIGRVLDTDLNQDSKPLIFAKGSYAKLAADN